MPKRFHKWKKEKRTRDPHHDKRSDVLTSHMSQLQIVMIAQLMQGESPLEEGFCLIRVHTTTSNSQASRNAYPTWWTPRISQASQCRGG